MRALGWNHEALLHKLHVITFTLNLLAEMALLLEDLSELASRAVAAVVVEEGTWEVQLLRANQAKIVEHVLAFGALVDFCAEQVVIDQLLVLLPLLLLPIFVRCRLAVLRVISQGHILIAGIRVIFFICLAEELITLRDQP